MYVEIKSKSKDNEKSRGKTTWFNTGSELPLLRVESVRAEHLGHPKWHVCLNDDQQREVGNGERFGDPKSYEYKFEMQLTPKDLAEIVQFALTKGLVKVSKNGRATPVESVA
jgi:hypothetical protein